MGVTCAFISVFRTGQIRGSEVLDVLVGESVAIRWRFSPILPPELEPLRTELIPMDSHAVVHVRMSPQLRQWPSLRLCSTKAMRPNRKGKVNNCLQECQSIRFPPACFKETRCYLLANICNANDAIVHVGQVPLAPINSMHCFQEVYNNQIKYSSVFPPALDEQKPACPRRFHMPGPCTYIYMFFTFVLH
ncbi:hypothetical protein HUJ04_002152 [Dendroctonus ponderosae]|nr:hypothetical protein HUJ04_002152 [Dendroctonus ponderosae]